MIVARPRRCAADAARPVGGNPLAALTPDIPGASGHVLGVVPRLFLLRDRGHGGLAADPGRPVSPALPWLGSVLCGARIARQSRKSTHEALGRITEGNAVFAGALRQNRRRLQLIFRARLACGRRRLRRCGGLGPRYWRAWLRRTGHWRGDGDQSNLDHALPGPACTVARARPRLQTGQHAGDNQGRHAMDGDRPCQRRMCAHGRAISPSLYAAPKRHRAGLCPRDAFRRNDEI